MLSHVFRLTIAAAALLLAAASGTSQPQQQQPQQQGGFGQNNQQAAGEISANDIVGWKIQLDKPDSLAGPFGMQARKYGCRTYNEDAWGLAAQCNEGIIIYKQEQQTVLIGCAKITEQQCRDLFSRILNAP